MVCFSVGYRLTQERPAPQAQPIKQDRQNVARGRIDVVRELLGLPPATDAELIDGNEAAFADVAAAFRFVHANAARWQVDASRLAIGGFSAGGFSAAYATYALGVPAAAVVVLSGGMDEPDAAHYLRKGRGGPPLLTFVSEFDLPGVPARTEALISGAERAGVRLRRYHVPARPHFYDRATEVTLEASTLPGAAERGTVESTIADFLAQTLA